ncbi:hypothetical protein [Hyalangium versicolor]|uniref:hypothetical protein n=1 Tax=Hyalangium versicolor TaxID=2861190 RepID=UPI001CCC0B8A|nr:hypothetical protein [Hyalangium versicolor]
MRLALLFPALMGLALAGYKAMASERYTPVLTTETCSTEYPRTPAAPTLQYIPSTGDLPTFSPSTHIVVVVYPRAGGYAVAGVDVPRQSFTFLWTGYTATLDSTLIRLVSTGTPVTVYTAPLDITCYGVPPPTVNLLPPSTFGASPVQFDGEDAGVPPRADGGTDGGTVDCSKTTENCRVDIGDDPPGDVKPGGEDWIIAFLEISWRTAINLGKVATPLGGIGGH